MRASQILREAMIVELNMSPQNLQTIASKLDARVGMEFEMYVPNSKDGSESESEADYSYDRKADDIDDVVEFFYNGGDGSMSRYEKSRMQSRMEQEYLEWCSEKTESEFEKEKESEIRAYVETTFPEEDWETEYEEALEGNSTYDAVRDDFFENYEPPDQRHWLREAGMGFMSNIEGMYGGANWPFYTDSSEAEVDYHKIANAFKKYIGRHVKAADGYHSAKRDNVSYIVEPDQSLSQEADPADAGVEFISPPLTLDEMLSDLRKVKQYAEDNGCYTNRTTGLHINVSLPNFDKSKVDYIKLALLVGDEHILAQFGRSSNSYTKSALQNIQSNASQNTNVELLLQNMRAHMNDTASKMVYGGNIDKYVSINLRNDYVEFRSVGGDWLEKGFDQIPSIIMRFIVALDASMDPNKHRQEYLKKLYQLLRADDINDPISYFARYAAGMLPKPALASFIRELQAKRSKNRVPSKLPLSPKEKAPPKEELVEFLDNPGGGDGDNGRMTLKDVADEIMKIIGKDFTCVKAKYTNRRWEKTQPGFRFIPKDITKYGPAKIWCVASAKFGEAGVYHTMMGEYFMAHKSVSASLDNVERGKEKTKINAMRTALLIIGNTNGGLKQEVDEAKVTDNPTVHADYDDEDSWLGKDIAAGITGRNMNVDYEGLRVMMKPSTFLKLAAPLGEKLNPVLIRHMEKGGSIASPYLTIQVPKSWEEKYFAEPALVVGHEGRNRMTYILHHEKDDSPIEVHLFLGFTISGEMRHRELTNDMIRQINRQLYAERPNYSVKKGPLLQGPFFTVKGELK